MNKELKLLIFDLDDTLLHSNIKYSKIRLQIANLFPNHLSKEIISKTPILELLKKLEHLNSDKFAEGYRIVDEAEKEATQTATVISGAEKIPEMLKKYALDSVIYTNNSKRTIELYLANPTFKFLKKFYILTRDDVNHPKPDPEGLLSIIKEFRDKQITEDNTIYIGDSYIDAIAADKANIRFIWFNSRKIDQTLFPSSPYAILTEWSDFEAILKGLC
ncbi:MAG: HAD hydrolase-like protein [Candidatus Heimdallarchaeota archaeon]|nr:MAG: HAD hydrolase-like protein [Candidatus Heimdallarchaeota archaeon]